MKNIFLLITTFIVLLFVYTTGGFNLFGFGFGFGNLTGTTPTVMVQSSIDGRFYQVKDLEDKHIAANLLAKIRAKLIKLMTHMKTKYPNDVNVKRMVARFNPNSLQEGGHNNGITTYTANKGDKIVYCLRSRKNKQQKLHQNLNILMMVSLHEMAHLMDSNHNPNHTGQFSEYFTLILTEAKKINIFDSFDYSDQGGVEYCGMQILQSPI